MTAAIIGPTAVPIAIMIAMTIMLAAVEPIQEVFRASAECGYSRHSESTIIGWHDRGRRDANGA